MKKSFIIILIFLSVFLVIVRLYSVKMAVKTDNTAPVAPTKTVPAIPAPRSITFPGDNKVVFSYAFMPQDFPVELPSYLLTYPTTIESSATYLASLWGFSSPVKKPVPFVYDWIEKEKHMSINTKTNTLTFAYFYPFATSSIVGRLTVESLLQDISKAGLLQKGLLLVEAKRDVDVVLGEGLDGGGFPSTFISYQYKLADQPFPFIFSGVNKYAATARTVNAGGIVSFTLRIPPFIKPLPPKKTLSSEEILSALNENKGLLASAGAKSGSDPYKLVESFSAVEITSMSVGYFLDESRKSFDPVFILSGNGFGADTYGVTYYLRATE